MSDTTVALSVNGRREEVAAPSNTLLVDVLRQRLHLTGTHVGCDTTQCGACTVHLNGEPVKSCTILAAQADGGEITTVEGLGSAEQLHPMQAAFRQCHGLQCGFCTPGMIMAALGIVARHPEGLDEATVRQELSGNLCRCTGYHNIVAAVLQGARDMATAAKSS